MDQTGINAQLGNNVEDRKEMIEHTEIWDGWVHGWCGGNPSHEVVAHVELEVVTTGDGPLHIPTGERAYFVPDVACNRCPAKLKVIVSARKVRDERRERVESAR